MEALAITGASGFLGRALLAGLAPDRYPAVHVLSHRNPVPPDAHARPVIATPGDLLNAASLQRFAVPGCTVVHLAYLSSARPVEDNTAAAGNLLAACRESGVRRLIYCSSAVVAGDVPDDVVNESTACRAKSVYEIAKLEAERLFLAARGNGIELAVLRPTAVFGPGGRNLAKLAQDLQQRPALVNYAKSCLQGRRRMNLVHVDNVVGALRFLIDAPREVDGEVYIVSDDESPLNNYRDVERLLARGLGMADYALPPVALPRAALSCALSLAGRSNTNPARTYDGSKLLRAGFRKTMAFDLGIASYAAWVRSRGSGGRRQS